jgi:hypothetical protein
MVRGIRLVGGGVRRVGLLRRQAGATDVDLVRPHAELVADATVIGVGTTGLISVNAQLASLVTIAGTVEDPNGNPVGGSVS